MAFEIAFLRQLGGSRCQLREPWRQMKGLGAKWGEASEPVGKGRKDLVRQCGGPIGHRLLQGNYHPSYFLKKTFLMRPCISTIGSVHLSVGWPVCQFIGWGLSF